MSVDDDDDDMILKDGVKCDPLIDMSVTAGVSSSVSIDGVFYIILKHFQLICLRDFIHEFFCKLTQKCRVSDFLNFVMGELVL